MADHIHSSEDEDVYHAVIRATDFVREAVVVGPQLSASSNSIKPVMFNGLGLRIDQSSHLGFSILRPPATAYSLLPTKKIEESNVEAETDISLVIGVQGRNNARIVFSAYQRYHWTNRGEIPQT